VTFVNRLGRQALRRPPRSPSIYRRASKGRAPEAPSGSCDVARRDPRNFHVIFTCVHRGASSRRTRPRERLASRAAPTRTPSEDRSDVRRIADDAGGTPRPRRPRPIGSRGGRDAGTRANRTFATSLARPTSRGSRCDRRDGSRLRRTAAGPTPSRPHVVLLREEVRGTSRGVAARDAHYKNRTSVDTRSTRRSRTPGKFNERCSRLGPPAPS
jgi:hypothetical protein